MFSPRRLVRMVLYIVGLTFFVSFVLLIANHTRSTHIKGILPSKLVPSYFQPGSESYIVDIAINDCNIFTKSSANCGIPGASEGLYGDVGINGGWVRVEKDLLLGLHWTAKRYLSIKRISREYYKIHGDSIILDITVGDPVEDCAIQGNTKCIPKSVIADINKKHILNEEGLIRPKDLDKDEKLIIGGDESKSTEMYNKNYGKDTGEKQEAPFHETTNPKSTHSSINSGITDEEDESAKKDAVSFAESKNTKDKTGDASFNADRSELLERESPEIQNLTRRGFGLGKRYTETSYDNLKNDMRIPSDIEIADSGWTKKTNNIWVRVGKPNENSVSGVDVLFGEDAVDPRPNWSLIRAPLKKLGYSEYRLPRLSIRRGRKIDYKRSQFQPEIEFGANGKFKILQVADLHFSTGFGKCRDPFPKESIKGCQADPRTIKFLNRVLDIEKPEFVVMTGDQVFGDEAPDPETALFKAVDPFIRRKIPFAITLGNHDDESILSREQMMKLASSLPYSFATAGPENVDGFGNYVITVRNNESKNTGAIFYFLDSHSYSKQPKTSPGYDWFKESQIEWLKEKASEKKDLTDQNSPLSMAFFHIPLPEYLNLDQPRVGQLREGITAPRHRTGMREALGAAGVQVASCGHDHENDFFLVDTQNRDTESQNSLWLCYGGAVGEGGYGGREGLIRRLRIFELDSSARNIKTWKRAENNPDEKFDDQIVVEDGKVVTSVW